MSDKNLENGIEAVRAAHENTQDVESVAGLMPEKKPKATPPVYSNKSRQMDDLGLMLNAKDRPIWNMKNAMTVLTRHADWQGVLAYNEFAARRVLLRPIQGEYGGTYPRPVEDGDYAVTWAWFNQNGFPRATGGIVQAALRKVCEYNAFDPLKDYLNEIEWDGVPRLDAWLTTYCGVAASAYTSEVGKRWCISAVARGLEPGCKADHMLVLEGKQGHLKSTALAALAGEDWFCDSLPQMGTKDASSYLNGRWIVEVSELEAMRREVDVIKSFISRQVEIYRKVYDREETEQPRRCVFAGTTNKDDWHQDETGGRRFWPVKVGEIDVEGLKRDRDQLWAEAVARYRNDECWWLKDAAIIEAARKEIDERRADDPWRSDIAEAIENLTEVSTKKILTLIGVATSDLTMRNSKRVGKELLSMGWRRDGQFTCGIYKGSVRYVQE